MSAHKKTIGVILCGSGFKDGSEIRESVAVLWALSQHPVKVKIFAPDEAQMDVVNCLNGEVLPSERRNMLVESARIARGKIESLRSCQSADLDAIIIPGGFGVAKNLCDFATKGAKGQTHAGLSKILIEMFQAEKAIGAVCIAPALIALQFKDHKIQLTLGKPGDASQEIEKLGHQHIPCEAFNCVVDLKHKIVSTPAYMIEDAPLFEIFEGIKKCVEEVVRLS